MTTHTRNALGLLGSWARSATALLLVLVANGRAAADGEPPKLPQVSHTPMVVSVPAAPTNVEAVLVDRMAVDAGSPARYSSQDFVVNQDDSQGADDFCIPAADASWHITNVDVVGAYNDAGYAVASAKVFFMTTGGTLPGTGLYTATVTGASLANANSGSFAMTLTSPAHLAGGSCYWVSVQAVQPDGYEAGETWQWTERTAATADHWPSAYRLPGKPGHACETWGPRLATCFPGSVSNPDFALRLSGSISNTHLTPQIATMTPPAGLNEDVTLTLTGLNFAQGATISWTVGVSPTQAFAASVLDGGHLTATIPAGWVGPTGTATVQVLNPSPCVGSCASNALPFSLHEYHLLYAPIIVR